MRFRGNLVVDGATAFEEETWELIKFRETIFKVSISKGMYGPIKVNDSISCLEQNIGTCYRCQMICVDQETSDRDQGPLAALASYRGKKLPFGVHMEIGTPDDGNLQLLEVGYRFDVISLKKKP